MTGASGSGRPMSGTLRLLIDPPCDGAGNMAVDEAILQAVGRGQAPPTLRMYRWSEPTLSVGYSQACEDIAAAGAEVQALPLVRRPTGGGGIVHADELTYSLVLPVSAGGTGPAEIYRRMNAAIISAVESLTGKPGALRELGRDAAAGAARPRPFYCFDRRSRNDLLAGTDKLAGAAQRRTGRAVLQHGSLILRRAFPAQPSSSLAELAGREVSFEETADALARAFREGGASLEPGRLTQAERAALGELKSKHASAEWLRRR